MKYQRNTAHFPAGNITLFKKQVITWAGNFFSSVCIDHNNYLQAESKFDFIGAADAIDSVPIGEDYFEALKEFHSLNNDWLFGFLTYDLKNEIEPTLFNKKDQRINGVDFPLGYFFIPKHIIEIRGTSIFVTSVNNPHEIYNDICKTEPSLIFKNEKKEIHLRDSKEDYIKKIEALKEHIANGDLYEVNLCQEFFIEEVELYPASLFNILNQKSPAPFSSFIKHDKNFLICASPERFMKKEGSKIISQPMKGTIRRITEENDSLQKQKLINDEKERAENVMIVDLVRNDLAKSAVAGSVIVEELFGIYTFPQVHQMISTVTAQLRPNVHFTKAIKNAFPMGSMTGAPKVKAMELIDKYETVKRGLFSGAAGFITPDGDFDFNVVIRSVFYNSETKYLSFKTGGAITFDCNPENEYEECMLKAQAIISVFNSNDI